jgi:hypothetical protein
MNETEVSVPEQGAVQDCPNGVEVLKKTDAEDWLMLQAWAWTDQAEARRENKASMIVIRFMMFSFVNVTQSSVRNGRRKNKNHWRRNREFAQDAFLT